MLGPSPARARIPDRGIPLFLLFFAAVLVMVLAIWLTGAVDRWWILIVAIGIDCVVTFAVLAAVVRLLGDGDDT
jgi:hypothetical protein